MFERLRHTLHLVRPRSLSRMQKSLDDLAHGMRDVRLAVKEQGERERATQLQQRRDADELNAQIRELSARLAKSTAEIERLAICESQLRAVAMADAVRQDASAQLPTICDERSVVPHVREAIARADLVPNPLPYLVVSDVFPSAFYEALVQAIPPYEMFADRPHNRRQLKVPLPYGPAYSRAVWTFLDKTVLERGFQTAIIDKLKEPLGCWIAREWPQLSADPLGPPLQLHTTDGRVLLRGSGYCIRPHRDPKWSFVTVVLYLARPGDDERWGTQFYSVEGDAPADGVSPHWIDPGRCHLAADVPFRPNTALVFLNSCGAHGASIAGDAEPADLQRYIYQFRIGPTRASIQSLLAMLPPERRAAWEGKMGEVPEAVDSRQ